MKISNFKFQISNPKYHLLSAVCLPLLVVAVALSQGGVDPKLAAGFNAIREKNLRADLTFLAGEDRSRLRSRAAGE